MQRDRTGKFAFANGIRMHARMLGQIELVLPMSAVCGLIAGQSVSAAVDSHRFES